MDQRGRARTRPRPCECSLKESAVRSSGRFACRQTTPDVGSGHLIVIRHAVESDAAAAIDVVRRSISELCAADHHNDEGTLAAWLANKTSQNFLGWLANTDNFCVVAESESRLIGVGVLNRGGEILLFYLAPGAQRQGVGKLIHAALEETAKQWGLSSLHLNSTTLACPFYESLGYHRVGAAVPLFGVLQCFPYAKSLKR